MAVLRMNFKGVFKQKPLLTVGALLIGVSLAWAGVTAIVKTQAQTQVIKTHPLTRFYPINIVAYAELNLDSQSPWFAWVLKQVQHKNAVAKADQKALKVAMADSFHQVFLPKIAVGAWPINNPVSGKIPPVQSGQVRSNSNTSTQAPTQRLASPDGQVLIALTLKKAMSFPQLLTALKGKITDFKPVRVGQRIFYQDKYSQTAFGVVDNILLISDQAATLKQFLLTAKPLAQGQLGLSRSVLDTPGVADLIGKLNSKRQGLVILNTQLLMALSESAMSAPVQLPATQPVLESKANTEATPSSEPATEATVPASSLAADPLSRFPASIIGSHFNELSKLGQATPISVTGIEIQEASNAPCVMTFQTLTPAYYGVLARNRLKDKWLAMFDTDGPIEAPRALPRSLTAFFSIRGLDKLFDLYLSALAKPETTQQIEGASQMAGAMELDLRKDLIDLVSGELSIALVGAEHPEPVLMLSETPHKQQTLNHLIDIVTKGSAPVQVAEGQLASVKTQVLSSSKAPFKLTMGSLDGLIGFGVNNGFELLAKVKTKASQTIRDESDYQLLTQGFPTQMNALGYVNLTDLIHLISTRLAPKLQPKPTEESSPARKDLTREDKEENAAPVVLPPTQGVSPKMEAAVKTLNAFQSLAFASWVKESQMDQAILETQLRLKMELN